MKRSAFHFALGAVLLYMLAASLWVAFAGVLWADVKTFGWLYANKDILFVGITSVALFVIALVYFSRQEKAFENLRQSEERYRTIAHVTYDWEYWIGTDDTLLYVSPSCECITGYTPEEFLKDPSLLKNIVHPEDYILFNDHKHAGESRETSSLDFRIIRRDGEIRWVAHRCQMVYAADGQCLGRRASNRDITERKKIEEALSDSESRYRQLVDFSPYLIGVHREGKVVYINLAGAKMLGAENPEDIIGLPILKFVHPDSADIIQQRIYEMLRDGIHAPILEEKFVRLDGKDIDVEVIAVPFDYKGQLSIQVVASDITQRKQIEQALRQSEKKFRLLAENAQDVIYDLRYLPTPHYEYISPSVYTISGYTAEELTADPDLRFKILHPDDQSVVKVEGVPNSRVTNVFLARLIRKNGEEIWIETNRVIEFDQDGQMTSAQGVLRDINDHKKFVDQLRLQSVALEAVANAIMITDTNANILWVNNAFTQLTGYSLQEVIGQNARILNSGLQTKPFYTAMWQTIASGGIWQGEIINRRKDATLYDEMMAITPVKNEDGTPTHFVAIKQDITERKRSEELRSRLIGILEASTDFVATFDLRGHLLYVNQSGRLMLGIEETEHISNLTLSQFYSSWSLEIFNARGVPTALREGVWSGEVSIVDREGHEIPVSQLIVAHKNANGEIEFLSSVMRDITDRKRREREMMAIVSITISLRGASTHAEMLPAILDKTINLLKVDGAILAIADTNIPSLFIELGRGEWSDVANTHLMSRESLTHHVMNTLDVYISNNITDDLRFTKPAALNRARSVACAPLVAEGRAIGVMWIGRQENGGDIDSNDLMLLDIITSIAANAIYRATLYEQTQLRAEQLAAVNALGRAIAETFDLNRIYSQLHESIVRLLPYIDCVFISFYDADTQLITCAYGMVDGQILNSNDLPPIEMDPPGIGAQSEAIYTRQPFFINNLPERMAQVKTNIVIGDQQPQSGVYAPMVVHSKIIGVIQALSYISERFRQDDADLLSLVANTAAIAIENARLFAETAKRMDYLLALRNIDMAITASVDTRFTLNVVLDQVRTQLHVDAAAVLLSNSQTQTLEYAAGKGFKHRHIENSRLRWGDGTAGQVAMEHRPIFIPDVKNTSYPLTRNDVIANESIVSYYAVPLIVKGKMEGVLEIFQRTRLNPDREWQEFLESLAAQAAVAIDNAIMLDRLQRSNAELTLAYDTTLEGWSRALDLRDHETENHTMRVTEMTLVLAKRVGVSDEALVHIRRGAILHDIGKIGVPDNILLKPSKLTPKELELMQRHPVYAYELLASVPFLRLALDIPYCHHEHYDGNGYPRRLKGNEIPLAARIFSVVDHWDALVHDRPYRKAWSHERVREYLQENANKIFDPRMVKEFLKIIDENELI